MAQKATLSNFVETVAEEVSSGIDRALGYWLGRIELELIDHSLTVSQRMDAIEGILYEYKMLSGRTAVRYAA